MNMSTMSLFQWLIQVNSEWNKGIIMLIFKMGNRKDLNTYRGIILWSCVSKMFNIIITDTISGFLESNKTLSEIQVLCCVGLRTVNQPTYDLLGLPLGFSYSMAQALETKKIWLKGTDTVDKIELFGTL